MTLGNDLDAQFEDIRTLIGKLEKRDIDFASTVMGQSSATAQVAADVDALKQVVIGQGGTLREIETRLLALEQLIASKPWQSPLPPPPPGGDPVFVSGQTKPDSTNCGTAKAMKMETAPAAFTGDRDFSGIEFRGRTTFAGGTQRFEHCAFSGPVVYDDVQSPVVRANSPVGGQAVLKFCRIRPLGNVNPGRSGWHGIQGTRFTLDRCDVSGYTDAVDIVGGAAVIKDSYLHHVRYHAPDRWQSDGVTHNDLVQLHLDVVDVLITGSTLEGTLSDTSTTPNPGGAAQCIMVAPVGQTIRKLQILDSWLEGPANFGINFTKAWGEAGRIVDGIEIARCKFGRIWRAGPDFAMIAPSALHPKINAHDNQRLTADGLWEPWNTIKNG